MSCKGFARTNEFRKHGAHALYSGWPQGGSLSEPINNAAEVVPESQQTEAERVAEMQTKRRSRNQDQNR